MTVLDFDTVTDVDLEEMMGREIPCHSQKRSNERPPPSWCTATATHWMSLHCRTCNKGGRYLLCQPCATIGARWTRIVGAVVIPWFKHGSCRRPIRFRVRTGAL